MAGDETGIKATGIPLGLLADKIEAVGGALFKAELGKRLGATALKLIDDEFAGSVDPYGRPWAPITYRSGLPLVDTGRLRNSFSAYGIRPMAEGFEVGTKVAYSEWHQYGVDVGPHVRVIKPKTLILVQSEASPTGWKFASAKQKRTAGGKTGSVMVAFTKIHGGGFRAGMSTQNYTKGIHLPRRQMLPEPDTGGVGERWGFALNAEADDAMREQVGQDAGGGST